VLRDDAALARGSAAGTPAFAVLPGAGAALAVRGPGFAGGGGVM
jgi:hypothetical protein